MPALCISANDEVRTRPTDAEAVLPKRRHVIIDRTAHENDLWISSPEIADCIFAFFRGEPIPARADRTPAG